MATDTDIVNRALQAIGTRTTVTSLTENTNEAIQANLVFAKTRDEITRMAPWNSATNFANATYITSVPGTPENATAATVTWQKGQPAPPWQYEYQYPVDCLRELWIVPQFTQGFPGVPIFPVPTGPAPSLAWSGPPVRFKVGIDQFFPVMTAVPLNAGSGYVVGEIITLSGTPAGIAPIGAPVRLQVLTLGGGPSPISTVAVLPTILDGTGGGSYFAVQANPVSQASTTGSGVAATFNLTFGAQGSQRVIWTNQEQAIFCYLKQITDPNIMDPMLQQAWVAYLAARLAFQLTGDTTTANQKIGEANGYIVQARAADGNESLTINNVTPDWMRIRGIEQGYTYYNNACQSFDWGPLLAAY